MGRIYYSRRKKFLNWCICLILTKGLVAFGVISFVFYKRYVDWS